KSLETVPELAAIHREDPILRNLIDTARKVEGLSRHASTHAAGVVISKEPLANHVPLQRVSKGNAGEHGVMIQFAMEDVARIGLLKMDFLGLANLSILGKAIELIKEYRGITVDLHNMPLDDKKTYQLLASGETGGVFQLEGSGMRRYIRDLKPTVFNDITAMVALYRPGPMEHIPTFIRGKHGEEQVHYVHPVLAGILEETYGVIVYQEQVLFIVREFAGYSLGKADIFRKAMGKKNPEVMKKEKINFIEGAKKRGFTAELAEQVFALIEPFAGYAFNKAHAASYALIAYQTAYLKANYPVEYMTALLSVHAGVTEKITTAVSECRRLLIKVRPPDINRSQANFSIEKDERGVNSIRFGLTSIKNVGVGAIESIITERNKNGVFQSIEDLCRRCDLHNLNKRVMESLIKAGAFDELGARGTLLNSVNEILSLAQREQKSKDAGQSTMFDLWGAQVPVPVAKLNFTETEISVKEKLAWEKELMGVYLSEHPFSIFAEKIAEDNVMLCGQIEPEMSGQTVMVAGMVASVSHLMTKAQKPFIKATLEDLDGGIEIMVWSDVYTDAPDLWEEGNILLVEGRVTTRDEGVQLSVKKASRYEPGQVKQDKPSTVSKMANGNPVKYGVNNISAKNSANVSGSATNGGSPAAAGVSATVNGNHGSSSTAAGRFATVGSSATVNSAPVDPVSRYSVQISVTGTLDSEEDVQKLHRIIYTLKEFPGRDNVSLRIVNNGKTVNLKLPNVYTGYSQALKTRLIELVGDAGLKVEAV
ncbi:MAG: DNA polymerase III subunit alpha, partial [Dehalococcoidales bacterium]|nr:DNA polymerase III subunit alpha [Dehalococcoidales bacterium]